jgi:hypothetical protein
MNHMNSLRRCVCGRVADRDRAVPTAGRDFIAGTCTGRGRGPVRRREAKPRRAGLPQSADRRCDLALAGCPTPWDFVARLSGARTFVASSGPAARFDPRPRYKSVCGATKTRATLLAILARPIRDQRRAPAGHLRRRQDRDVWHSAVVRSERLAPDCRRIGSPAALECHWSRSATVTLRTLRSCCAGAGIGTACS